MEILPFAVPGKGAWYLEGKVHPAGGDAAGGHAGASDSGQGQRQVFLFPCRLRDVTDDLKARLAGAALVFFDGTVWRDDGIDRPGPRHQDGTRDGTISMSGEHGAIESLAGLDIGRKMFLHINNSNPALLSGSDERTAAEQAGWQIPTDGTEITL